MPLNFYTRPECHLCELAWDVLEQASLNREVIMVNIEDNVELLRRYGQRIPVIHDPDTGHEIGWPFSQYGLQKTFGKPQE